MASGIVSFVGGGPGDPALRVARAVDRLERADVVFLPETQVSSERLAELAREGKRVVRMVAGDALGSLAAVESVRAVARSGVPVEVIPGVEPQAAAAAFAGVIGRAVSVPASDVARSVGAQPMEATVTLVLRPGDPTQRVLVTRAAHAGAEATRAADTPDEPVVVAFGTPDPDLRWFESRPLFGKRILVTRARDQATSTATLLRDEGAEAVVIPTIAIHPPSDPAPLARAIADLRAGRYAWAVFTSENGVERTWDAVMASGGDARAFVGTRLAAIGPATARALARHGLHADVTAKEFKGEGLAEAILPALAGPPAGPGRVLLARAAKARDALPDALRGAGCTVDVVAAYETHPPPPATVEALLAELEAGRIDAVTFTSSSTVDNLCDLLGESRTTAWLDRVPRVLVASIGPITTATAQARGLRVDVTAETYTVPGLVRALAGAWTRPSGPH
jgi:uroporphyrinogen III methyltransferase/synthase